jgi:hypothetical protein
MAFEKFTRRSRTPVRSDAPAASGIYGASNAREWIYIGETDNIQASLLNDQRQGDSALMKRCATGFIFEPRSRAGRLAKPDRLILEYEPSVQSKTTQRDRRTDMMESLPERKQDKDTKTQFILTGFSQTAGIRTYAFEGIGDRGRADYSVEVDLALIPGYGIRIQDLPLLCRELLQQRVEPDEISALTFTEQDMRSLAERRATEREKAEQRKKPARHPANANPGASWRNPVR